MVVTSSVANDAFLSARQILLSGEERLCTERPYLIFPSGAADPMRRRDERSEIIMVFSFLVELYQMMSFLPSAVFFSPRGTPL
jgi:hypothetical protein